MARGANARKKARRRLNELTQLEHTAPAQCESQLTGLFNRWELEIVQRLKRSLRDGIPHQNTEPDRQPSATITSLVGSAFGFYKHIEQQVGERRLQRFKEYAHEQLKSTIISLVKTACRFDDLAPAKEFCESVRRSDPQLWGVVRKELQQWFTDVVESEVLRRANSLRARVRGLADLMAVVDEPSAEAVRDHVNATIQAATRMGRVPLYATVER